MTIIGLLCAAAKEKPVRQISDIRPTPNNLRQQIAIFAKRRGGNALNNSAFQTGMQFAREMKKLKVFPSTPEKTTTS